MKEYYHKAPDCLEHNEHQLELKTLIIKSPPHKDGMGSPFYYCSKSNKYLSENNLVTKEEAALNFINKHYKRESLVARIFKGKYKLSELKIFTFEEFLNTNL